MYDDLRCIATSSHVHADRFSAREFLNVFEGPAANLQEPLLLYRVSASQEKDKVKRILLSILRTQWRHLLDRR